MLILFVFILEECFSLRGYSVRSLDFRDRGSFSVVFVCLVLEKDFDLFILGYRVVFT